MLLSLIYFYFLFNLQPEPHQISATYCVLFIASIYCWWMGFSQHFCRRTFVRHSHTHTHMCICRGDTRTSIAANWNAESDWYESRMIRFNAWQREGEYTCVCVFVNVWLFRLSSLRLSVVIMLSIESSCAFVHSSDCQCIELNEITFDQYHHHVYVYIGSAENKGIILSHLVVQESLAHFK